MFDRDQWNEIFSTLKKNKFRTFLTAFGVFWGIFMLIIMLGAGKGLQNGVMGEFSGFATNSVFLWAQKTSKPYQGLPSGRMFRYDNDDIKALKDNIPEIDILAPQNQLGDYKGGNNVSRGVKTGTFSVMGQEPQFIKIQPIKITKGRFINALDLKERRKIAVIGSRVSEILFDKTEDPIGKSLKINGVYFDIVGVFNANKSGQDKMEQMQTVYIPFTTFQNAFNYGNKVGWFAITSKAEIPVSEVEEKVIALLKSRHKISPDDKQAIGHFNAEMQFKKMLGLFDGIRILVWVVGLGTLLAGIIGVSNIMLIIVKERTKEIGIKRAIGATPFSIVRQIILESIFLTSIAGYIGLIAGIGIIELVAGAIGEGGDGAMFKNPEVELQVAITALVVLIISGALAGFIPAKRAISTTTVEALRAE